MDLVIRARYFPLFWTANTEFENKKIQFDSKFGHLDQYYISEKVNSQIKVRLMSFAGLQMTFQYQNVSYNCRQNDGRQEDKGYDCFPFRHGQVGAEDGRVVRLHRGRDVPRQALALVDGVVHRGQSLKMNRKVVYDFVLKTGLSTENAYSRDYQRKKHHVNIFRPIN